MRTSLKNNEHIILETRLHWLTLAIPFLVTVVPAALLLVYLPKYWYIDFVFILYFLFKVYERRSNLWVVTNLRIIDEEGVFSRYSKESPLDKINNVSSHQSVMGSIFGFGDIEIQTGAEAGATIYRFVASPNKLRDAITTAQSEYAISGGKAVQQNDKVGFASELEKLFELKQKGVLTEEEYQKRKSKMFE
ncbi:MAG TPA: PH domain-containing protein [Cyclobacteriaceae bacterium]|nr:PH domain-containing protein [Cyclobacteriaceae bacterium]